MFWLSVELIATLLYVAPKSPSSAFFVVPGTGPLHGQRRGGQPSTFGHQQKSRSRYVNLHKNHFSQRDQLEAERPSPSSRPKRQEEQAALCLSLWLHHWCARSQAVRAGQKTITCPPETQLTRRNAAVSVSLRVHVGVHVCCTGFRRAFVVGIQWLFRQRENKE